MLRLSSTGKIQPLRLPVLNADSLTIAELTGRISFSGGQAFPAARWQELSAFSPNVLVAAASELQRLIERIDLRTIESPEVDYAVFVLTEVGDRPLSNILRVTLWQRFGVPVYELYIGPNHNLLARECEAQEGWHVEPGVHFFLQGGQLALQSGDALFATGLTSRLETEACSCGRSGLRIVSPGVLPVRVSQPLAASA